MRKLLSIALLILCCKNMYSQSAGWKWVDNKEDRFGDTYISMATDNECFMHAMSTTFSNQNDTFITKFTREGKCIDAAIILGKKYDLREGKIMIQDTIIKAVVNIIYGDTIIIGKDTIFHTYPTDNWILLYIELNASDLTYRKVIPLAIPSQGDNHFIHFFDFEMMNNSIIINGLFNPDSLLFSDSSYFTIQNITNGTSGIIIKYDTEKEKYEWKKVYNTDSLTSVTSICKKAKIIYAVGYYAPIINQPYHFFAEAIDAAGAIVVHKDFNLVGASINKIVSNNLHIYCIGRLGGSSSKIDNKTYNLYPNSFFIGELDNQLNILWIKTGIANIIDIAIDEKNILTLLGEFKDTLQFQNFAFHNPFYGLYKIDAANEMFFMRLDSSGNLLYIEHHEVPFHHHAEKLYANNDDIFISGYFHFQTKIYIALFGNISVYIDKLNSSQYCYIGRYTISKLFFNIYLGTCKDSITVEHDPEYTTFNWFLNDTIYIGSGEKIKWNTNYLPSKYNIKVVASGANVCDATYNDTLTYVHPLPPVDIGNDTSICINDSLILSANIIGNYSWNTNDTTQSIITKKAGKYFVTVYDSAKCFVSDTIIINYFLQQKLNLGRDFSYCIDSGLPILSLTGYKNYLWSTGETSASIQIKNPAQYSLLVTDSFNCKQYDTIEIIEVCPPKVYVPNSFTPNNDGLNDVFKPSASFIEKYTLAIYNKWGELLYTGTEKDEGWNGKYRNAEAKEDIYIWLLTWTGKRDINYDIDGTQQGTVILIRKGK